MKRYGLVFLLLIASVHTTRPMVSELPEVLDQIQNLQDDVDRFKDPNVTGADKLSYSNLDQALVDLFNSFNNIADETQAKTIIAAYNALFKALDDSNHFVLKYQVFDDLEGVVDAGSRQVFFDKLGFFLKRPLDANAKKHYSALLKTYIHYVVRFLIAKTLYLYWQNDAANLKTKSNNEKSAQELEKIFKSLLPESFAQALTNVFTEQELEESFKLLTTFMQEVSLDDLIGIKENEFPQMLALLKPATGGEEHPRMTYLRLVDEYATIILFAANDAEKEQKLKDLWPSITILNNQLKDDADIQVFLINGNLPLFDIVGKTLQKLDPSFQPIPAAPKTLAELTQLLNNLSVELVALDAQV